MSLAASKSIAPRVVHWAGCLLGTALLLLFAAFAIGEGPPPLNWQAASLAVMLVGFLLAWWRDLVGGVVSLAGIAAFYGLEFAASGHAPGGWLFPLCFVPGVLGVVAWLLTKSSPR